MTLRGIVKVALLVVGAAVIVATAFFTLSHMNDRVIFTVLVPGVVVGLILIVLSFRLGSTDPQAPVPR